MGSEEWGAYGPGTGTGGRPRAPSFDAMQAFGQMQGQQQQQPGQGQRPGQQQRRYSDGPLSNEAYMSIIQAAVTAAQAAGAPPPPTDLQQAFMPQQQQQHQQNAGGGGGANQPPPHPVTGASRAVAARGDSTASDPSAPAASSSAKDLFDGMTGSESPMPEPDFYGTLNDENSQEGSQQEESMQGDFHRRAPRRPASAEPPRTALDALKRSGSMGLLETSSAPFVGSGDLMGDLDDKPKEVKRRHSTGDLELDADDLDDYDVLEQAPEPTPIAVPSSSQARRRPSGSGLSAAERRAAGTKKASPVKKAGKSLTKSSSNNSLDGLVKEKKPRTWKKPKDKPKRPLSAYNLFFQHERAKIVNTVGEEEAKKKPTKQDSSGSLSADEATGGGATTASGKRRRRHRTAHGKIGFAALAQNIAAKWKELDPKARQVFEARAAVEKTRYKKEMDVWNKVQKEKRLVEQRAQLREYQEQRMKEQMGATAAGGISPQEQAAQQQAMAVGGMGNHMDIQQHQMNQQQQQMATQQQQQMTQQQQQHLQRLAAGMVGQQPQMNQSQMNPQQLQQAQQMQLQQIQQAQQILQMQALAIQRQQGQPQPQSQTHPGQPQCQQQRQVPDAPEFYASMFNNLNTGQQQQMQQQMQQAQAGPSGPAPVTSQQFPPGQQQPPATTTGGSNMQDWMGNDMATHGSNNMAEELTQPISDSIFDDNLNDELARVLDMPGEGGDNGGGGSNKTGDAEINELLSTFDGIDTSLNEFEFDFGSRKES